MKVVTFKVIVVNDREHEMPTVALKNIVNKSKTPSLFREKDECMANFNRHVMTEVTEEMNFTQLDQLQQMKLRGEIADYYFVDMVFADE
jgi:hypothetical protein